MKIELDIQFTIKCSVCPNYIKHAEGGDAEHYSAFEMSEICESAETSFKNNGWTAEVNSEGDITVWRCPEHPVKQ